MMSIVSMQRWLLALAVLAWPTSTGFATDPANLEQAAERIGQALNAEIDGDFLSRAQFLKEAEQLQADFAPAHWYRGEVIGDDGQWLSVDEAIAAAKSNKLLDEYEAMRAIQPANVQGNWQAAMWCAEHNMLPQCRAHLENMLMLDHDNVMARQALGHQLVGDDWLTPADMARMTRRAEFAKLGYAKYYEPIGKLFEKTQHASLKVRQKAFDDLNAIDDPLAIPVMEGAAQAGDLSQMRFTVQWLGKIDHQEASLALARIAMFASHPAAKQQARDELKGKPLHDFVPELLSSLSSPLYFSTVPVFDEAKRFVGFRQFFAKEGMDNFDLVNFETKLATKLLFPEGTGRAEDEPIAYDMSKPLGQRITYRSVFRAVDPNGSQQQFMNYMRHVQATMQVAETYRERESSAVAANQLQAQQNARVAELISGVTEAQFASIPHDLWKWWDSYNETNYQNTKFSRRRYSGDGYVVPAVVPTKFEVSIYKDSCFVAGTMINTLRGLQAIETLMPGDMVLARNIANGELCYQPVVCRTTRAPSKTVLLEVNDETIHSTTSHLLWVSGKGWTKAGDIQVGELLHSAAEPAVVMSSTPGVVLPTHNLVVADAHTYFVGSSRVLSHDVLPRGAVHERVPGEFLFSATSP